MRTGLSRVAAAAVAWLAVASPWTASARLAVPEAGAADALALVLIGLVASAVLGLPLVVMAVVAWRAAAGRLGGRPREVGPEPPRDGSLLDALSLFDASRPDQ
ncbi:MAG TPA: hypothetical protein VFP50_02140 [Anaeromyxobacteraceae bacterium]|nr:hypothetical protein [Anaeromyxobacteraceae bacterium]